MTTDHHLDSPFACYTYPFLAVVPIDSIDPGGMWGYCGLTASRPSNPYIQTLESIICGWLQTNPCGVEAANEMSSSPPKPPVTDEPLWGRSIVELIDDDSGDLLQTNPCGVEAAVTGPSAPGRTLLQTNPCGVEASVVVAARGLNRLQTNPCGVEARAGVDRHVGGGGLQTNPCGVEAKTVLHSYAIW